MPGAMRRGTQRENSERELVMKRLPQLLRLPAVASRLTAPRAACINPHEPMAELSRPGVPL